MKDQEIEWIKNPELAIQFVAGWAEAAFEGGHASIRRINEAAASIKGRFYDSAGNVWLGDAEKIYRILEVGSVCAQMIYESVQPGMEG